MRENIFIELISLMNNGTNNKGISPEVDVLMGKNKLKDNLLQKIKKIVKNGK